MTISTPAVQSKDTTVLLVDDNALTRSVLRTILRQDGYRAIREAGPAWRDEPMATSSNRSALRPC